MAKVFLSYDRDDTERARPVALALEKAGHAVWWDLHIRGGEQYTKVIDEALKAADAVVVLWSKYSVESAWVRDEAAAGRDTGRLVPAALDGTDPPLGFRQFQTIDLSQWRGRGKPSELKTLLADVEAMSRKFTANDDDVIPPPIGRTSTPSWRTNWLILAVAALVLLGLAAIGWKYLRPSDAAPTVAVEASESSPPSQALAHDLFVKLGSLQAANSDAVKLVSQATGNQATLIFGVAGNAGAVEPNATLVLLNGKDRSLFWSREFATPRGQGGDLKQQLGFTAARLVSCAAEALSPESGRLDQDTLKLYLNACASLTEIGWDRRPVLESLRQVVTRVPKFQPAWAKLIVTQADLVTFLKDSNEPTDTAKAQLRADIARAGAIDPNMAEIQLAEVELMPRWNISEIVRLVDKAKMLDSDNPAVLSARSESLQLVGRMEEAIVDADRAAQLDPLSPQTRTALIRALAYGGVIGRARQELARAKMLWPGTITIRDAEDALELRFGDFERFMANDTDPAARFYIQARHDPSDANVQMFLNAVDKEGFDSPRTIFTLQALGEMNRVNEFYNLVGRPAIAEFIKTSSYALFRPWLANVRRDPRFVPLAKRLGLLNYWQSSGKWPDFCSDPALPYDCKKEAAKLAA